MSATNFSIVNQPGAGSYPISGYSWALIYVHQINDQAGLALVQLMDWLTHAGQAYAAAANYVPLPSAPSPAQRSARYAAPAAAAAQLTAIHQDERIPRRCWCRDRSPVRARSPRRVTDQGA